MKRTILTVLAVALVPILAACGDDDSGQNGNENQNNNTGVTICGNGQVEAGEQCDDGAANSDLDPDACRSSCRLPYCGDGIIDSDEECDDAGANSDRLPNACRSDCQLPHCGDGVIDPGETCDDGNATAGDGCDADCQVEPRYACDGVPSVCDCARYHTAAGCQKCVVYVDADNDSGAEDGETWATAFTNIRTATDAAYQYGPGCDVWVAEGRYAIHVNSQHDTVELRSGVGLYGSFRGDETERDQRWGAETTLAGEGGPHDLHAYHVLSAIGVTDATVDGFTVQGGNAEGAGVDELGGGLLVLNSQLVVQNMTVEYSFAGSGGGLYAWNSDLELRGIYFRNNEADDGGALFLEESRVVVADCTFERNRGHERGGAIRETGESLLVTGSAFTQNEAHDEAAISTFGDNTVIEDSSFERNEAQDSAGAVGGTPSRISDCVFLGNLAGPGTGALSMGGGLVERCSFLGNFVSAPDGFGGDFATAGAISAYVDYQHPMLRLESCLVAANRAGLGGGGLWVGEFADVEIVNCTLAQNQAVDSSSAGGAIHVASNADATVINSIVWGNTAVTNPSWDNAAAYYSIAEGLGFDGTDGNRSWDPAWPAAVTGQWTDVRYDNTLQRVVLTDSNASFPPGDLEGAVIHYGPQETDYSLIEDNTATEIYLRYGVAYNTSVNTGYTIYDLRLPTGSPALDAGQGSGGGFTVPALDLMGNPRVDDATTDTGIGTPTYVDLGCFERQ